MAIFKNKKMLLFFISFLFFSKSVSSTNEFFEIINQASPINQMIVFMPGNVSFVDLDQYLFNQTKYFYTQTIGYSLPNECSDTFLDRSKTYSLVRPVNKFDNVFNFLNIKFPFLSVLSSNVGINNNSFCLIFNKRNFGLVFNYVIPIPCMVAFCYMKFISASLSTENGLVANNNFNPVVVYDTMRYHTIESPKQFGLRLEIGFPFKLSQAVYYGFDEEKGFHFRMKADLNIVSHMSELDFIAFQLTNTRIDLFLLGKNLISFQNNLDINGVLRDSKTEALETCFPSGLFFSLKYNNKPSLLFGSKLLAGIIGNTIFDFKASYDAGYYFNMRKSLNNGFFMLSSLKLNLFHIVKINVDLEVQFINKNELNRRLKSLQANSYCADPYNSVLTSYFLDKFTRSKDLALIKSDGEMRDWNRFFFGTKYYFGMYIKTKGSINIPLINRFVIKGEISGKIVMPSPREHGKLYYIELSTSANILNLAGAGVTWSISDTTSDWKCYGYVLLFEVDVHLTGPSNWLHSNGFGSLISSPKYFKKLSIKPNFEFIKKILKSIGNAIKKVGQTLSNMYNGIKNTVKESREKIKKKLDKLCRNPPCLLSNLLSNLFAGLSSLGGAFNAVFGRTKRITTLYSYDDFNCPIWRTQIKKCVWKSCSTIGYEFKEDKPCIDRIKATLLEAKHEEQLANWKEDVVEINMLNNLGIQFAAEEIEAGNEVFDESDLKFEDIFYEFSIPQYFSNYNTDGRNFNPNDTSFTDEFDMDMNDIFNEFDDTDIDIDLSSVYQNTQNLNIVTTVTINTARLSALFKGKDNITVDLTLPANFNFESDDAFEKSTDLFIDQLSDQDGPFFKAIIGDNVGITDDLIDAYGMNPPIITIRSPLNPTVYCDDPEIDQHYGANDSLVIEGLRKYLTPLHFEQIYRRCKSNIEFHDEADCREHEDICGATNCVFTRFVFDGCGQRSNEVYENITILPKKPFFIKFPDNIPLSCDETKNVTQNIPRFIIPDFNPGCRNIDTDIYYEDSSVEGKCLDTIYRKWRVEMVGCENSLFTTKSQKLYIEDSKAPYFIYFPPDKTIDFFDSYGTEDLGVPQVYDSCGHGPSYLTYDDQAELLRNGERLIKRTWSTKDTCGNKREKIQKILVKNSFKNDLNNNFKNFVLFSFNQTEILNSFIHGELGSREKISLINSTIGNDEEIEDKCIKKQKWTVLSGKRIQLDDSIIHGSIKSLSDFNFDQSHAKAIELSKYFNDTIRFINIGTNELNCFESTLNYEQEFPIDNYLNSTCSSKNYKQFSLNVIDETKLDLNKLTTIKLKGTELVYNLFYFKNPHLFENKEIRIEVPSTSFVIINFENKEKIYLNLHKIKFNFDLNLIDSRKIIYNFLNDGDIIFEENDELNQIDGTILAPYSNFIKMSKSKLNKRSSKIGFINGQVFAKNIYIDGLDQSCDLFEPLQD